MSLLDKATIITTPTAHSNGVLHSIKGGSVADFDVVRGSAATRVNSEGLIEDVATNIPRIDYTDGTASILLEPQSTNLVTYSEDFSNASWVKLGASVVSGFDSPDGGTNAYKLVEDASAGVHLLSDSASVLNGSTNYNSIYVKPNGASWILLYDGANNERIYFDLQNKVIGTKSAGVLDYFITEMSGGWLRIGFSSVATSTSVIFRVYLAAADNVLSYTGDGVSGVYLFGAQVEAQSYATSYIPTSGAIATRLADLVTGAGDATTFNSTEGVLYAEIAALSNDGTTRIISLSDGTDTNRIHLFYYSASNGIAVNYRVNGSTVVSFTSTLTDINDFLKIAFKWQSGNFNCYVNGLSIGTNSNTTMLPLNTLNKLSFTRGDGSFPLQGKVKSVITFDTALTDEELICLTTI